MRLRHGCGCGLRRAIVTVEAAVAPLAAVFASALLKAMLLRIARGLRLRRLIRCR